MDSEQEGGKRPETQEGHQEKHEKMCSMMEKCCAGMSIDDKNKMREELTPKMMKIMGGGGPGDMMGMMMKHCMRRFRWFPYMPLTIGVVLLLLGIILSAEAVKALWLIFASIPIVIGVFMYIVMNAAAKAMTKEEEKRSDSTLHGSNV